MRYNDKHERSAHSIKGEAESERLPTTGSGAAERTREAEHEVGRGAPRHGAEKDRDEFAPGDSPDPGT